MKRNILDEEYLEAHSTEPEGFRACTGMLFSMVAGFIILTLAGYTVGSIADHFIQVIVAWVMGG